MALGACRATIRQAGRRALGCSIRTHALPTGRRSAGRDAGSAGSAGSAGRRQRRAGGACAIPVSDLPAGVSDARARGSTCRVLHGRVLHRPGTPRGRTIESDFRRGPWTGGGEPARPLRSRSFSFLRALGQHGGRGGGSVLREPLERRLRSGRQGGGGGLHGRGGGQEEEAEEEEGQGQRPG